MNTYITDYPNYCLLCGKPNVDPHHLVFGGSLRKLADEDGLVIPVCRSCHDEIHANPTASRLSKMLGQTIYELNENAHKGDIKDAREKFRARYGRSYL